MNLVLAIFLIMAAFAGGVILGMYLLRRQVEKEFAENPRLNVEAVRTLLSASGQRPNEAKVQQVTVKLSASRKLRLLRAKRKNNFLEAGF